MGLAALLPLPLRLMFVRPARDLLPMEKELLCAMAADGGWLTFLRTNDREWLRIGEQNFVDTPSDPSRRTRAIEARACLLRRGYVRRCGNREWLTPEGKRVAGILAAREANR